MSSNSKEFFGNLRIKVQADENHNGSLSWVVVDDKLTRGHTREIEDGDFLEVVDDSGRPKLSKIIYRDYDAFYSQTHQKQLFKGAVIAWAAEDIAMDYWYSIFHNRFRARLIKAADLEPVEES